MPGHNPWLQNLQQHRRTAAHGYDCHANTGIPLPPLG